MLNLEQLKQELIVVEFHQQIETKQVERIDHYNLESHLIEILKMIVDLFDNNKDKMM